MKSTMKIQIVRADIINRYDDGSFVLKTEYGETRKSNFLLDHVMMKIDDSVSDHILIGFKTVPGTLEITICDNEID